MLPSFRQIAATFVCGFMVVFAGLRIAASLNDIHEALPVMAAHAAPMPADIAADPEMRRSQSAVPVMYDMRFVTSTASMMPTLARLTTPPERIPPIQAPLVIIPPVVEMPAAADTEQRQPGETLAAIASNATIDAPAPGPMPAAASPIEPPRPETLKPETPVVAAADPQAAPEPEPAPPSVFDIPLIEPAEVDLSSIATKADVTPAEAPADAKAAAVAPAATVAAQPPSAPTPDAPTEAVDLGSPSAVVTSPPMPKARPALRIRAKASPVATAAPQPKRRIRTARRAKSDDPFGSSTNSSFKYTQSPFGSSN